MQNCDGSVTQTLHNVRLPIPPQLLPLEGPPKKRRKRGPRKRRKRNGVHDQHPSGDGRDGRVRFPTRTPAYQTANQPQGGMASVYETVPATTVTTTYADPAFGYSGVDMWNGVGASMGMNGGYATAAPVMSTTVVPVAATAEVGMNGYETGNSMDSMEHHLRCLLVVAERALPELRRKRCEGRSPPPRSDGSRRRRVEQRGTMVSYGTGHVYADYKYADGAMAPTQTYQALPTHYYYTNQDTHSGQAGNTTALSSANPVVASSPSAR